MIGKTFYYRLVVYCLISKDFLSNQNKVGAQNYLNLNDMSLGKIVTSLQLLMIMHSYADSFQ